MDTNADASLIDRLAAIVGPGNVMTEPHDVEPYSVEQRGLYHGRPAAVVRPGSVEEVAAVVRLARETATPIVPQGGNTGLVGAQVPDDSGRELIVSTQRLDRIRDVDVEGRTATVEAGVVLERVQQLADEHGLLFPLALGSQGSCRIGGNISTNAGGTGVLAYGNTRELVLGLEVVLASGEVWNGLSRLRKDNTGYDLKQLFIGGEGTLGLITAAVVRLFPKPKGRRVAYAGLNSPQRALELYRLADGRSGGNLTGVEIMSRIGVEFAVRHMEGLRDPLAEAHPWYVLLEVSSNRDDADAAATMEDILGEAFERGIVDDAAISQSEEQAAAFWRIRHDMSLAQKPEGGSIKHDVSVPVARVPELIERAAAELEAYMPGIRPVPFGHLGDGNIHLNFSQPVGMNKQAFMDRAEDIHKIAYAIVLELDGSVSAEHGIGRLKRGQLEQVKSDVELDMMRRIKRALDPNNVFNPGRMIRLD